VSLNFRKPLIMHSAHQPAATNPPVAGTHPDCLCTRCQGATCQGNGSGGMQCPVLGISVHSRWRRYGTSFRTWMGSRLNKCDTCSYIFWSPSR
jgi:hypothetical protein